MNEAISREDALQRFPELASLATIEQAGWPFRIARDAAGEPECVTASRSIQRYTDALFIYDRNNIVAARVLAEEFDGGGCVWMKQSSSLEEVIYELLGLPEPGEPGAPSLVKQSSLLWTP
jgi:hypothetical protein